MNERRWPIAGFFFAGLHVYEACEDGSVWSRWRRGRGVGEWKRLTGVRCKLRGGYLKVTLSGAGGIRVQRYVHNLILEAFVGPCPEGMECLHGDGDPVNNCLDNLRWGTPLENAADTRRHGRHFTPFARPPKLGPEKAAELQARAAAGATSRYLAKEFGVSKSTAWSVIARQGVYAEGANVV